MEVFIVHFLSEFSVFLPCGHFIDIFVGHRAVTVSYLPRIVTCPLEFHCDCQLLVSCAHTFRWKQRTHRRVKARIYVVTGTVACVCSLHTSENISLAPFKKEKSGKGNEGKESQSIVRDTSLTQHLAQRCSPSMANKGRAA